MREAASERKPVPAWHLHRRLYDWVLSLAHHTHASTALFLLAFAESSFFPVPPDVLQMALTLERRERAWWYAAVSTAGSVLGGILGWLIGWGLWAGIDQWVYANLRFLGLTPENFGLVRGKFDENAFLAIFTAAFTPIPYKVFTIAGGVFHVSLITLIVGSLLGRGARFFLVAAFFWVLGAAAKRFIERWFNLLTIAFTVLLIGGFLLVTVIGHRGGDAPGAPGGAPVLQPGSSEPSR